MTEASARNMTVQDVLRETLAGAVSIWCRHGGSIREWEHPFGHRKESGLEVWAETGWLDGIGEIRTARIEARSLCIVNLFLYPEAPSLFPVVAMECVTTSKRGIVAVVDFAGPSDLGETGIRLQRALAREAVPFRDDAEMPDWYRECRSGFDLFCRPGDPSRFHSIGRTFLQLWETYLNSVQSHPVPASTKSATRMKNWVTEYKQHHCANSPAWKLFERTLGESWTQRFLEDHHFR